VPTIHYSHQPRDTHLSHTVNTLIHYIHYHDSVENNAKHRRGGTRSGKGGGSIAPLRMSIHNKKPEVIILTETRVDNEEYNGKGIFRGYDLTQHSSSGRRAAGVMVFIRKGIAPIQGTIEIQEMDTTP
jgi:exonuclease III